MTTTTERTVRADFGYAGGCYIIEHADHISCLGFDVTLDRIERIATELVGRHALPEKYLDTPPSPPRGSLEAYDTMQNLLQVLQRTCEREGVKALFDQTPQLMGLEGYRVEVVDSEGDEPRRFVVGRSTGWAPIHLEVSRRNSSGGPAARREYRHVRQIERVW